MDLANTSIQGAVWIFIISACAIAFSGAYLSKAADRLADLTGLGEAVVGAIFLGAVTSLPGLAASFTAAVEGHPRLSVSSAIGGIAAQTVFLTFADLVYPKANLEHAAASLPNIMQAVLLILLLVLLLVINIVPEVTLWWIHPGSLVLIAVYILGQIKISRSHKLPMWLAVKRVRPVKIFWNRRT